jgi:hypothetical protein
MGASVFPWPGWSVEPMTSSGGRDKPRHHARSLDLCSPDAPQSRPPVPSSAITLGRCRIGTENWATPMRTKAPAAMPAPGAAAGTRSPSAHAIASSPCGQVVLPGAARAVSRSNAAASVADREPDATGVVGHDGWLIALGVVTHAGDAVAMGLHGHLHQPGALFRRSMRQHRLRQEAGEGQCSSLGHCSRGQAHGLQSKRTGQVVHALLIQSCVNGHTS